MITLPGARINALEHKVTNRSFSHGTPDNILRYTPVFHGTPVEKLCNFHSSSKNSYNQVRYNRTYLHYSSYNGFEMNLIIYLLVSRVILSKTFG